MKLSESGDRYAYLSTSSGGQRIFIVSPAGGKPIGVDVDAKNKVRWIDWAGDDYVIVTITGANRYRRHLLCRTP